MFRSDVLSLYGPPVPTSLAEVVDTWSVNDVVDWLQGVDESVVPYLNNIRYASINGRKLLGLTASDLRLAPLSIRNLGVRQVIVQSIDLLMQLCYNMETENLQSLAMKLSVGCTNLCRHVFGVAAERRRQSVSSEEKCVKSLNAIIANVSYVVDDAKRIISWLDRSPFDVKSHYVILRNNIMNQVTVMLKVVQVPSRNIFQQLTKIERLAENLYAICEDVVRSYNDSAVLETAFLERAIVNCDSSDCDLGINLSASYQGIHMISEVQLQSPADLCGKVDAGDEIIQINGHTVVGWDLRNVVRLLSAPSQNGRREIVFLLKKRPRDPSLLTTMGGYPKSSPVTPNMNTARKVTASGKLPNTLTTAAAVSGSRKERRRSSSFSTPKTPTADERNRPPSTSNPSAIVQWRPAFQKQISIVGPVASELDKLSYATFYSDDQTDVVDQRRQRRATVSGGSPSHSFGGDSSSTEDPNWLHSPVVMRIIDGGTRSGGERVGRRKLRRPAPMRYRQSYVNRELLSPDDVIVSGDEAAASSDETEEDDVFVGDALNRRESQISMDYATIEIADPAEIETIGGMAEWTRPQIFTDSGGEDSNNSLPLDFMAATEVYDGGFLEIAGSQSSDLLEEFTAQDENDLKTPLASEQFSFANLSFNSQDKLTRFFGEVPLPIATRGISSADGSAADGCEMAQPVTLKAVRQVPSSGVRRRDIDVIHPSSSVRVRRPPSAAVSQLEALCSMPPTSDDTTIAKAGYLNRYRLSTPPKKGDKKWLKQYAIIQDVFLLLFSSPKSFCADCVIRIPRFSIRPSNKDESSIKKYLFKVENSNRSFYFACNSRDEMIEWMNKLGLVAIEYTKQEKYVSNEENDDFFLAGESRPAATMAVSESPYATLPRLRTTTLVDSTKRGKATFQSYD